MDALLRRRPSAALAILLLLGAGCGGGGSHQPAAVPPGVEPTDPDEDFSSEPTPYTALQLVPWCSTCVDASQAVVTVDGTAATAADIREGDVVLIRGTRAIARSEAYEWKLEDHTPPRVDSVTVTTLLQGPVESVDPARGRLIVMGQQVQFLHTAVDSPMPTAATALGTFNPGDMARVSGYRSGGGAILATRIDHAPADAAARLVGRLRAGPEHLLISELAVDVSAAEVEGLPGGARAGDAVAVSGDLIDSRTLRAERVIRFDPIGKPETGTLVTVEGLVVDHTTFHYPPSAKVTLVDLTFEDDSCEYDAGFDSNVDQLWRMDGVIRSDLVDVVCYLGNSPLDHPDHGPGGRFLEGPIEAVDLDGQTMTVQGKTVQLTFVTRLGRPDPYWGPLYWIYNIIELSEVEPDEVVEVSGRPGATDNIVLAHTITIKAE